jgi:hypothetical protein
VNIIDEEDRRAPDWRHTPAIANLALLVPEMKGKHTHTHTHTKQTHFPAKPSVKRLQLFSSGPRVSTPQKASFKPLQLRQIELKFEDFSAII